jgi:broad specificity phosphatase PhoE
MPNPASHESAMEATERLERTIREISSLHPGKRIAIVTHGFVPQVALQSLTGQCSPKSAAYCSISEFSFKDPKERPKCVRYASVDHLV